MRNALKLSGFLAVAATGWMSSLAKGSPVPLVDLQIYDVNPNDSPTGNPDGGGGLPLTVKTGAAAIGGPNDVWNVQNLGTGPGFTTPLLATTTGAPTSVVVSLDSGVGSYYEPPSHDPLLQSYAVGGNLATGTISGLTPGATYNLYLYGTNGRGSVGATFTIDGNSQTASGQNVGPVYSAGVDYVMYTENASAGGTITFTDQPIAGPGNCCFILNGLQIEGTFPTPEPATLSVLGLAGAGGLMTRRRRA